MKIIRLAVVVVAAMLAPYANAQEMWITCPTLEKAQLFIDDYRAADAGGYVDYGEYLRIVERRLAETGCVRNPPLTLVRPLELTALAAPYEWSAVTVAGPITHWVAERTLSENSSVFVVCRQSTR